MARDTRYDKLARKIRRDHEHAETLTNSDISAGGSEVLVNASAEHWRTDNETLAQYRPYNSLTIDNNHSAEVRVYLRSNRNYWVDVPSDGSATVDEEYFNYIELEDNTGSNSISSDGVVVSVAKVVDSRELRLLEMSGMLNVGGGR